MREQTEEGVVCRSRGADVAALAREAAGEIVALDVRPEEYAVGHIPGAIFIPVEELADRIAELPEEVEVVAYSQEKSLDRT
ncbi:rhodanese-like domain-containing protein [Streptomyces sp. NPDC101165]|uniref:rhodanese-like domain-containing protein n=1 Tax=Streptomyces sp. NPDC101165 TaxID=3366119 RepID=UPI0037FE72C9